MPITPEELRQILDIVKHRPILNFISHTPTINLLNNMFNLQLQPNRGKYVIEPGDLIITLSLAERAPQSGQDVTISSFDQLVIRLVKVIQVIS